MTEEEIKEEAVRLNRLCFDYHEKEKRIAELEKENEELKTQIDKLKSCSNCKFLDFGYCKIRCKGDECNKKDKWELEDR